MAAAPTTSGPFTLIADQGFRGDGEYLYTKPGLVAGDDDARMEGAGRAEVWQPEFDVSTGTLEINRR